MSDSALLVAGTRSFGEAKELAPYQNIYNVLLKKADLAGDDGEVIPSYNQLAEQFEVSTSTVVRAINLLKSEGVAYGKQGRATYIRRRPKSTEHAQIAFITPSLSGDTNPYVKGLSATIDSERFTIATYSIHGDLSVYQNTIEQVISLKPAGIVLMTLPDELCSINPEPLIKSGIPVVILGAPLDGLVCDRVFQSGKDSGKKLARYLLENGYNDFSMLMTPPRSDLHKSGLVESLQQELLPAGLELPSENICVVDVPHGYTDNVDPYIDVQQAVIKMIENGRHFKTLICGHDYPAVSALRAILSTGLRVPEDVAIVSGVRCAVDGATPMKLTTIDTHREEQAHLAVELLVRRIDGFDGQPEVHYIAGELVEGKTA